MSYQVQVRQYCPEWAKLSKSERTVSAATTHHDSGCKHECGYGTGDCWVYRWYPIAELSALLMQLEAEDSGAQPPKIEVSPKLENPIGVPETASTRRRGRPKATPPPPAISDESGFSSGAAAVEPENLDDLL